MKLLAIETSAKSASCAWWENGALLAECFTNAGAVHSRTVLPMVGDMLRQIGRDVKDAELFAVSQGPGSFTGLRIGIAAAKGMAMALERPCAPVSTLLALAYNVCCFSGYILPVMDARCAQVYTALFRSGGGQLSRLWEDSALPVDVLGERLAELDGPVLLVGDGAELLMQSLPGNADLICAPPTLLYPRAGSLCLAALELAKSSGLCSADQLAPAYLRLPQAQRELQARQGGATD